MKAALLILMLFCGRILLQAQTPFVRDVWINEAGTPVKTNALAQDSTGMLWLATEAGLYAFNGRDAVPATDSSKPATAVTCTDRTVFFGCRDGSLYRYQNTKPVLLVKANATINTIINTPYGLLAGTLGDGLYVIAATGIYHYSTNNGLPDDYVYSIAFHNTGILIGTDLGFFKAYMHPAKGVVVNKIKAFDDIGRLVQQEPHSNDLYWLAFSEKGLVTADATGIKEPIYSEPDTFGTVSGLHFQYPDIAWIVTEKGWLVRAQRLTGLTPVLSLGRKINAIAGDATGNLWLATNQGLTMITAEYLQHLDLKPSFSLQSLSAMASDGHNDLYYTQGNELWKLDQHTKAAHPVWHATAPVNCLYIDRQQRIWIGTSGKGVICSMPGGVLKSINSIPTLKDAHILSITGDDKQLWVSSLNGVEEITLDAAANVQSTKHHGKRDGIGSDYVYRIFIDNKSRIWFATDGAGLTMYDHISYQRWDKQHGFSNKVVYGITEDANGDIWAATLDGGLSRYDNRRWQQLSRKEGLQDATVFTIAANRSGGVMAVTSKGIDLWYPKDGEFRHINKRSALGIDSFSNALNAAVSDTAGNVWIPYQQGFLVFANQQAAQSIHPAVVIKNVALFFKVLDTPRHHFVYDENHLTFRFTGINFAHPDKLRYRYRLEGFNEDFIETTDEVVTYTQLPPGKYRFCIQATMHELFEHQTWDSYSFVIEAPVWQRWWFWGIALLLGAVIIYSLLRWRVRSLQKVAQLKHERMVFEYEHLKSQVNPHFLFNSLNTLASLIEEDPEAAVNYTVQLSDLYRDTLSYHERDLVPLIEEWAVLERYFYIQHSRFGAALQLQSTVTDSIKQTAKIIPLALQLLIENAIKHNVVSRSAPLIIFIDANEHELTVRNAIHLKTNPEKSTGLGLTNIKQRYARITKREVHCLTKEQEFIVILPLL